MPTLDRQDDVFVLDLGLEGFVELFVIKHGFLSQLVERHVRDTPSVGQRHDEAVQALRPYACPRQRPGGARGREQRRREGTGYRHDDMRHGRPILDMEGRA